MTDDTEGMQDLANLAQHVRARREELDLTQLDVWNAGGPSNSTLTAIESARPPAPSRSTLRKLDHALRWVEGSAKAALSGGSPTPSDNRVPMMAARVRELEALVDRSQFQVAQVRSALDAGEPEVSGEDLRSAEDELVHVRQALEFGRAELARLAKEAAKAKPVGAGSKDADSLLYRRPDGVSDQEWERIRDQSRDYIEWLIDKAARER